MEYADEQLFLWINGLAGKVPLIDRGMQWVVSDYLVPVGLAISLVGLWFAGADVVVRRRHQLGVLVALTSVGVANLAVWIVNGIYFRPRPFINHEVTILFYQPTDSSFPANTTAVAFGIAAAVWCVNRRIGILLLLISGLYAFSRIYVGVHYPMDVTVGALLGIAATTMAFRLASVLQPLPSLAIKIARIFCLA